LIAPKSGSKSSFCKRAKSLPSPAMLHHICMHIGAASRYGGYFLPLSPDQLFHLRREPFPDIERRLRRLPAVAIGRHGDSSGGCSHHAETIAEWIAAKGDRRMRITLEFLLTLRSSVHCHCQKSFKIIDVKVDMNWCPVSLNRRTSLVPFAGVVPAAFSISPISAFPHLRITYEGNGRAISESPKASR
jgi:hypothetical protein